MIYNKITVNYTYTENNTFFNFTLSNSGKDYGCRLYFNPYSQKFVLDVEGFVTGKSLSEKELFKVDDFEMGLAKDPESLNEDSLATLENFEKDFFLWLITS